MSEILYVHPQDPQPRVIQQAVRLLQNQGLLAYPTDSGYALGWTLGNKDAQERVSRLRQTDKQHNFTVVCRDLSEISRYAQVDNVAYRLIKSHTPGPYTFILPGTRELPRRLLNEKRKSVGIRIPDHAVALALLDTLGEAMMSSSLILPGQELRHKEPWELAELLDKHVDGFLDAGPCVMEPTTVIDLMEDPPVVIREGQGPVDFL